jgi:hypothetical protein
MAESKNIHAEERTKEIRSRVSVLAWNNAEGMPSYATDEVVDDMRWLLNENERLRGALLIYTAVKH